MCWGSVLLTPTSEECAARPPPAATLSTPPHTAPSTLFPLWHHNPRPQADFDPSCARPNDPVPPPGPTGTSWPPHDRANELVIQKEKYKSITDELDQTFTEMSGY
ncbi:Tropomyosin [Portunus trituberculatus]|uniref:Tropomyosin n=1 Tax=Portunus trituberculatus TaxID=210409 RepID=A0A5B7E4S8_PORTR|nr:Tropomyosin [Portunus trituberculatus]